MSRSRRVCAPVAFGSAPQLWIGPAMLCAGLLALAGAGPAVNPAAQAAASRPASRPATRAVAPFNKLCPVQPENPVDARVPTVTFEGKTYGFCCEDCPALFKKNPDKYAAEPR